MRFKIRASACGSIMTNSRSKSEPLSKTCLSYVDDWKKEKLFNRRKNFDSKYTRKGNVMEDWSIDFVAEQLDLGMLFKNEQYFEDEHLTGTPDVILKDTVIDLKNSWDVFTFPFFDTEIPNKGYWWQGQVYMALTDRKHYKLIYVLSDTPVNEIEREAYWWCKNNGYEDLEENVYNEFLDRMTYSDVPNENRIKVFEFDRDDEAIKSIRERVELINSML